MTLPASGNLSLTQVVGEFGAPTGTPLSAFVRGGAWVPDTAQNAGVPTSAPIGLRHFLGAGAATVSITDQAVSAGATSPATATASYMISSDGKIRTQVNSDPSVVEETWLLSGAAADYEARATVLSGALSTGTTGTWLNLGTTRAWTVVRSVTGTNSAGVLIEIRAGSVLDSATITLEAAVEI